MPRSQRSNPGTKHKAIQLRKESTPAEWKLWSRIRNNHLGVTFRSQHLEQEEYDGERTGYLESLGYKVIRFWNNDVTKNIESVIPAIMNALEDEINRD